MSEDKKELTEIAHKAQSIPELADSMPESLPYGLREAMATLQLQGEALSRVPEAIFVRDVLPVLCGEEGSLVDMKWWGGRFDSPFKGFMIVDSQNNDLFEVPPLLDRNFKLKPPANTRDSVNEDRAAYKQRVYNRPREAKEQYKEALRRRIDLTPASRPMEHMKMLDKIFIHYGKPSIFEQAPSDEVRQQAAVIGKVAEAESVVAPAAEVFGERDYSDDGLLD